MIGIYESILSDPKYTCDIKAPMDQALLDGGHIKDGKGKRKLPPMLALTDRSGGTPSSAPHVSAGQKRAAAREAGVSKGSPDGGEGGSSSLYWLHGTGIGSGRQPRNKRQRTDSGPSSGGRRKKKRRGRYDDSDEEEDDPDDFLPSADDDDDDDDADSPTLMLTDKSGGEGSGSAPGVPRMSAAEKAELKRVKAEGRRAEAELKAASAAAKAERKRAADAEKAAAKAKEKAEKAAMRTPFARLVTAWPVGCRVEVEQVDEGYLGAWFAGTVTGHAAPDKLRVVYDELTEYDDETEETTKYMNQEPLKRCRPEPAKLVGSAFAAWGSALVPNPGDARGIAMGVVKPTLQLLYDGGWWDVLLLSKAGSTHVVKPTLYEIEHTVTLDVLRPKPTWTWDSKAKGWLPETAAIQFTAGKAPRQPVEAASEEPAAAGDDDDEVLEADVEAEDDEVEVEPMMMDEDE